MQDIPIHHLAVYDFSGNLVLNGSSREGEKISLELKTSLYIVKVKPNEYGTQKNYWCVKKETLGIG